MNDLDLINRLRAAGSDAPTPVHTPVTTLAAGRQAASRRQKLRVSGAALGLTALVFGATQIQLGGTSSVVAAADPAVRSSERGPASGARSIAPPTTVEEGRAVDANNAAILQKALGPDFTIAPDGATGPLRAGSELAATLPDGYSALAHITASVATAAALPQLCEPMAEKGGIFDGCTSFTLASGQVVHTHFSRWAPTAAYPQETSGEAVRVLFYRPDGVLVWVDLTTSAAAEDATTEPTADAARARAWLGTLLDRVGAAVTDPGVQPDSTFHADADPGEWNG